MKAMIFAAGLGTRLGKITSGTPKALVEVDGKSLLRRAVEKCTVEGFGDIIVNIHHFPDLLLAEIGELRRDGFCIEVSDETDELLETGGGLFKARGFFGKEPFLVYNADIVTDCNLGDLLGYHRKMGGVATLLTRKRPGNRFLLVDNSGRLLGWRNRSTGEEILVTSGTNPAHLEEIAFCGIHIIDPAIFGSMKGGVYSLMPFYLGIAGEKKIYTLRNDNGYWFDIGTPEKLEEANNYFRSK